MGTRRIERSNSVGPETAESVVRQLASVGNADWIAGMRQFGIVSEKVLGISVPELRRTARRLGRNHELADQLWRSGVFEARLIAAMIDDPNRVTISQMERWARDFDSWAIVDGCCQDLFVRTSYAWNKAFEWSARSKEYVKRAGFALVAKLAVHDRTAADTEFNRFLQVIEREAHDERPYVRKAVNWALREIGKRNETLRNRAIATAARVHRQGTSAARWIASDALRELRSDEVRRRLRTRSLPVHARALSTSPRSSSQRPRARS